MAMGTLAKTDQGTSIQCDDGTICVFLPGTLPVGPDFALGKRVAFDKVPSPYPGRFFATNVRKPSFAELANASRNAPMKVAAPAPVKPAVVPPAPQPESIVAFQGDAASFFGWVKRQATLVQNNPGLKFSYSAKYTLADGTISVPISIQRHNAPVAGTTFYFHYHEGVKGPAAGHGYASKWHFKPSDGAAKHIRIEDHQFKDIAGDLCKEAKTRAKA